MSIPCFKAYDVRGRVPDELDESLAYRIARAFADQFKLKTVVVGYDVRQSSMALKDAFTRGLTDSGCDVYDIGLCGTEQVYHAVAALGAGGGVMVTASHNPADYNGLKLVREDARPVSADTGLKDIERLVESGMSSPVADKGRVFKKDLSSSYIKDILSLSDAESLPPYKIVVNPGNGCAGPVVDMLEERLKFSFVKMQWEPDGYFPNGVPNPLLPENRDATARLVVESGAAMGVAWDGDFDRCFLFDEGGRFVDGSYIVGLLAEAMLAKHPGEKIVHDPRIYWNTVDVVKAAGGVPVMSKAGHAFMKERMRAEGALCGGEVSAHHFFREFHYCDSGMLPWLMVAGLMAKSGKPLSALVGERMRLFPVSGELNRAVRDPRAVLDAVEARYAPGALRLDHTDGVGVEYPAWRFNLRMSNTEPLVRLNVETRGDAGLLADKTKELLEFIDVPE